MNCSSDLKKFFSQHVRTILTQNTTSTVHNRMGWILSKEPFSKTLEVKYIKLILGMRGQMLSVKNQPEAWTWKACSTYYICTILSYQLFTNFYAWNAGRWIPNMYLIKNISISPPFCLKLRDNTLSFKFSVRLEHSLIKRWYLSAPIAR